MHKMWLCPFFKFKFNSNKTGQTKSKTDVPWISDVWENGGGE